MLPLIPHTRPPGCRSPTDAGRQFRLRARRRPRRGDLRRATPPSRLRRPTRRPRRPPRTRPRRGVTQPPALAGLGHAPARTAARRGRDGADPGGVPGERGDHEADGPAIPGRRRNDPAARGGGPHRAGPADDPAAAGPPGGDPRAAHGAARGPRGLPHPAAPAGAHAARRPGGDRRAAPRRARARRRRAAHLPHAAGPGRAGGGDAPDLRCPRGRPGRGADVVRHRGPLPGDPRGARGRGRLRSGRRRRPRRARGDDLGGGARLWGARRRCAVHAARAPGVAAVAVADPGGRRLDHLHLRVHREAQGRRDQPRVGGGVRRRRGPDVPPDRAAAARATGCWPGCRWPSTPPARRCGSPGVTAPAWCPPPGRW